MSNDAVDPQIVSYFEDMLAAAKEGRVLFVVSSVGVVSALRRDPLLILTGPAQSDQSPPRVFGVKAGGFLSPSAQLLAPTVLVSAFSQVAEGAATAVGALQADIESRQAPVIAPSNTSS